MLPSTVDLSKLFVCNPKTHNPQGHFSRTFLYKNLPLPIESPWMKNVFGINSYKNSNTKNNYSMSFSLDCSDPEIKAFREFIENLEQKIYEALQSDLPQEAEWFSTIRPSKKSEFPDTLRLKIKTKRKIFDIVYSENEKTMEVPESDTSFVKHGDTCRFIMELNPLWCINNKVGITWKLVRLQKKVSAPFNNKLPEKKNEITFTSQITDQKKLFSET